jgi:hypothetical protein
MSTRLHGVKSQMLHFETVKVGGKLSTLISSFMFYIAVYHLKTLLRLMRLFVVQWLLTKVELGRIGSDTHCSCRITFINHGNVCNDTDSKVEIGIVYSIAFLLEFTTKTCRF